MNRETLQSLAQRASQLLQAGRTEEAIEAHRRLLAAEPDLPDSWYNLGFLLRRARRFDKALDAYREALDRGVDQPEEVHLNRAAILAENLARFDEAEAELRAALALNPRYVPALLNLGSLHEDRGEREEARTAYAKALEIEPRDALALTRLVGVSPIAGPDDPLIVRLRERIARAGPAGLARADLGFALGQALDAAGAYDEAFAAYAEANRASRAAGGVRYDPAAHEAFVDRLIAAFPEAGESAGGAGEPPFFVCGMFRSGSTLAEQILASHSRVTPGGELDLLPALVAAELQPYPEAIARADAAKLERLRSAYLDGVRQIHPGADLLTDKRPDNFLHIGLIKRLFPQARIVHTVREPLDNCLSVFFAHLDPRMAYATDLEAIAHWHHQYRRLMAHWKALWPADIHEIDYDALVADPKPEIAALLDFCGLGWEEACLAPHRAGAPVRTASAWQVREPIHRASSGRWRNYETHLGPLRRALDEA